MSKTIAQITTVGGSKYRVFFDSYKLDGEAFTFKHIDGTSEIIVRRDKIDHIRLFGEDKDE